MHLKHITVASRQGQQFAEYVLWDFPFDFLPTNSAGLFLDIDPSPQICNPFCQVVQGKRI
jgi:hypothetical protein